MDLGPAFDVIVVAILSLPLIGYVGGTIIARQPFIRRELGLLVVAHVWLCAWYAIAVLGGSGTWHTAAENFNCCTVLCYPLVAGWFIVNGVRVQRTKRKNAARVCMYCGYDLRAQTVARCPECGRPVPE